jgi:ABC-type transporter Mla MlaB component
VPAICLSGPLTRLEVLEKLAWLEVRLPGSSQGDSEPVVIDLSGLTRVDTAAVTLMIALERRSRRQGLTLHWKALPASLLALLRLSSAESLFHLE